MRANTAADIQSSTAEKMQETKARVDERLEKKRFDKIVDAVHKMVCNHGPQSLTENPVNSPPTVERDPTRAPYTAFSRAVQPRMSDEYTCHISPSPSCRVCKESINSSVVSMRPLPKRRNTPLGECSSSLNFLRDDAVKVSLTPLAKARDSAVTVVEVANAILNMTLGPLNSGSALLNSWPPMSIPTAKASPQHAADLPSSAASTDESFQCKSQFAMLTSKNRQFENMPPRRCAATIVSVFGAATAKRRDKRDASKSVSMTGRLPFWSEMAPRIGSTMNSTPEAREETVASVFGAFVGFCSSRILGSACCVSASAATLQVSAPNKQSRCLSLCGGWVVRGGLRRERSKRRTGLIRVDESRNWTEPA